MGQLGFRTLQKKKKALWNVEILELKARWDKKGKSMVQGSLIMFIKPKPTLDPLMVAGTSLIQSNTISASFSTADIPSKWEFEERVAMSFENGHINGRSQCIKRLEALVKGILESIPEGSENDRLASFSNNPRNQDVSDLEGDELWEANLNCFLKEGWGIEDKMDGIVCQGENGMDGEDP